MTDASLPRRPQATAFSIEDLIDKVRRGEIRVPEFQRRLRWTAEDVRMLFDSIYRGYPVGTLLFWRREAPADRLTLGPVVLDVPRVSNAFWVVDGQQRITALSGVLLHPEKGLAPARGKFALFFDLEHEQFVRAGAKAIPAHWVPMNVVLDTERLLAWLDAYAGRQAKPQYVRVAHKLGKLIREYQLPAYVVEADDEQVLKTIFDRLNTRGKRLNREEVFNALHGSRNGEPPLTLSALSERLSELRFGRVPERLLLKAILAVGGHDVMGDFRRQLPGAALREALVSTERALRAVIVFLKRDAGIPHVDLLPYSFPVLPLARFFHLHPEPKPRSRVLLARWFWRGTISGIHQGESILFVRATLASVEQDEEQSVERLLSRTGELRPFDIAAARFDFRTAWSKVEANAFLSLRPRDLRSGEELDVASVLEENGASAFVPLTRPLPGARLPKKFIAMHYESLANRIFHPLPRGASVAVLLARASRNVPLLESHSLSPSDLVVMRSGQPDEVVRWRHSRLKELMDTFLNAKVAAPDSDRPSIDSLIVPD